VVRIGERRGTYTVLVGKILVVGDHFEDPSLGVRIILKWILEKLYGT
jgi:hypothetical protein